MPSKSMPQKRNHDFTERYPNMKAGTYEPMRIKDILTKNTSKTHNHLKFYWQRNKNACGC